MQRYTGKEPLSPSILESLRTIDPDTSEPIVSQPGISAESLLESVLHDLQRLLNSRIPWTAIDKHDELLRASLANYGVPDFSGFALGSDDAREELRKAVRQAIVDFEPRLRNVRVTRQLDEDEKERRMSLRIEAELLADPLPLRIVFDTQMDPVRKELKVEEKAE